MEGRKEGRVEGRKGGWIDIYRVKEIDGWMDG